MLPLTNNSYGNNRGGTNSWKRAGLQTRILLLILWLIVGVMWFVGGGTVRKQAYVTVVTAPSYVIGAMVLGKNDAIACGRPPLKFCIQDNLFATREQHEI